MSGDLHLVLNNYSESKKIFENEKLRLLKSLVGFGVQIEHIGSTAIPATIGKGIIDILVICNNEKDQLAIRFKLINIGYIQGELNKVPDGRLFFCNSKKQTQLGDIHLHLVIKNNINNQVSLKFRDYMLKHPKEVKAYNNEKKRIAEENGNSRHEYAVHKGDFIKKIMDKIEN
jgi:GrpB-like predicted nucleotidyltransferase (UPF0157 family)